MLRHFLYCLVASFVGTLLVVAPGFTGGSVGIAGHDDGDPPCELKSWQEVVRENGVASEDGVHAQTKIAGLDNVHTGVVRSIFIFQNYDNNAEVGWSYILPKSYNQVHFWAAQDAGVYSDGNAGYAGDKNVYRPYRLVNESGNQWLFKADGNTIKTKTFSNLDQGEGAGIVGGRQPM